MGPAVRFLLGKYNLDASKVSATGPKGTLLKGDVLAYLEKNGDGSAPVVQKLDLGSNKKTPKKKEPVQVVASGGEYIQKETNPGVKSAPHFYSSILCETNALREVTNDLKVYNPIVELGDVVTRAFILSLKANTFIEPKDSISIVALREGNYETKYLSNALNKSFFDISAAVNNPEKSEGLENVIASVFRFEGLGMDSIFEMLAPENTFSLTLGGFRKELKLVNGQPVAREIMEVTLSCDAAKVTPPEMGKIMNVLHKYLEHPHDMTL
eukprot:CAMPEP_0117031030 /NCGR_PEP_ID=MMETSP0472-20121206/22351_1 /TAXON_ID=693140 ORGANISM="Tiarina fusus, Strain LIS" /NCGR_SAMPLE_ID=MMETSP0472 /ASSEMBLY_ACC=CAM_ASM_000603 /LENGTH=267 /DNA_ID=CAMNT_0004739273 /DNA_START=115 /DNA_END=918 /DNA_ORIENTATION=-